MSVYLPPWPVHLPLAPHLSLEGVLYVGPPWASLKAFFGYLERSWCHFEPFREAIGATLSCLGGIKGRREAVGRIWKPSWAIFGASLAVLGGHVSHPGWIRNRLEHS